MKKYFLILLPLLFGMLTLHAQDPKSTDQKINYVLQLIRYAYVEKVNEPKIVEKALVEMLQELDPHSIYIPKEELEKTNEPLVGNFDGIGVQFQIVKDTIVVVEVIPGGPSDKLGLLAGDKFVKIDERSAIGDSITNSWVLAHLRGKKGTTVKVGVRRNNRNELMEYNIVRDKIPLNSIDTWFMVTNEIGYLRLDRFSRTSMDEFRKALADLKSQGMKHFILDLRGNGGGFMDVAIDLADEFLSSDKLIVYTEGQSSPKKEFKSTGKGGFEKGRLVLLIDEGSASASEIVSGAVQDWDRGIIIGRRSFGKGLVQQPFDLPDGSVIRLTTARYYTPSGRCIQKAYTDGAESYYQDYMRRYLHGEFLHPDSIKFPDSLKYVTYGKRVVYGGGGIMPDVFTPIDTSKASDYYVDLRRKNVLNDFIMDYMEKNRQTLMTKYPTFKEFAKSFSLDGEFLNSFNQFAEGKGVRKNQIIPDRLTSFMADFTNDYLKDTTLAKKYKSYEEYVKEMISSGKLQEILSKEAKNEDQQNARSIESSDKFIYSQLKALVARNLYGIRYYYEVVKDIDDSFTKALEVIQDEKQFKKLKINY